MRIRTAPVLRAALLAACAGHGCGGGSSDPAAAPGTAAAPLAATFTDRAVAAGLRFQHTDGSSGSYFIVETLASGVALFDFDNDGDLDVYFANGRPLPPSAEGDAAVANALYRNDGGLKFTDVTAEKGVRGVGFSVGACAGDYDNDGDLDLFVSGYGPDVLYRNEGPESGYRFTNATAQAGVSDPRFSAGAAFLDIDNDGDLDLYVANYCEVDFAKDKPCFHNGVPGYCAPGQYKAVWDSLFRNRGDGTFEDVSRAAGIAELRTASGQPERPKWGMGVLATDTNDDGWVDIYVANDVSDNFLFVNQGGGVFRNLALELGAGLSADGDEQGSMGVDGGDFDRDGRIDIVVTNFQKQLNALYRNLGPTGFSDVAMRQGLGRTCLPMVSWGTKLFDFDNDAWLDLFIANGHLEDRIAEYDQSSTYLQRPQLFRNTGGGVFAEVTNEAGPGLAVARSSRGAAFGDIDNDGDVDIIVVNSRSTPSLLVNEGGNRRPWVLLRLEGKTNRFAIGASVRIVAAGVAQRAEVRSGGSYASQNDLRLHFGLGSATQVDLVEVRWPGGGTSTFKNLEARRIHVLRE